MEFSEGESLDLEEVVDEFLTFFIAGQETTANTLAFAILELGSKYEYIKIIELFKLNFNNFINFKFSGQNPQCLEK